MRVGPLTYAVAVVLGSFTGYVDVRVNDLMLTAVLACGFAMFLSFLKPVRPWLWALLVAIFIPLGQVAAYWLAKQSASRAEIWEAALAFLPANAGAYGGFALRLAIQNLWPKK